MTLLLEFVLNYTDVIHNTLGMHCSGCNNIHIDIVLDKIGFNNNKVFSDTKVSLYPTSTYCTT